jgi:sugar phosphate isomerase/epimerase
MKLGIFAVVFEGSTPDAALSAVRRAGYDAVQYNMACSGLSTLPSAIGKETAEAVRAAAITAGVEIAAISATYNMIHPDPTEREKGRLGVKAIAASAATMGTRVLTVCTGTRDPEDQWRFHPDNAGPAAWDEVIEEFHLLLAIASEHDVFLGIEPELANVISSARRARDLLDALNNVRVKIVLDAANLFETADARRQRRLIDEALDLLGDSIAIAHAKDRLPDGRFATAGTGVLDYRYYLEALARSGFDGSVIAHGLASSEAARVADFLRNEMAAPKPAGTRPSHRETRPHPGRDAG